MVYQDMLSSLSLWAFLSGTTKTKPTHIAKLVWPSDRTLTVGLNTAASYSPQVVQVW